MSWVRIVNREIKRLLRLPIKTVSAFEREDIKVHKVYDKDRFDMPDLCDLRGESCHSFKGYTSEIPSLYVFCIKSGKCIIGREEVFTGDNKAVQEITVQKRNPFYKKDRKILRQPLRIHGSVANLSLSGNENNYGHFNLDLFARWHLLEKSGVEPDFYIFRPANVFKDNTQNY